MEIIKEQGLINSEIITTLLIENLRFKREKYSLYIGVFTNCRECGHTYRMIRKDGKTFTWCVYEHKNSDEIIINGKEGFISMNGDSPYAETDKYSYLGHFSYNQHYDCAERLKDLILEFIAGDEE